MNAPTLSTEAIGGASTRGRLAGLIASGARTLLLNASMEPLCIVSLRRAVVLVMTGKATVLESDGRLLHSEHVTVPLPVVLCLTRYVHVPVRRPVPPTRRTVLQSDDHRARTAGAARTPSTTCTRARAAAGTSGPTSSPPACGATTARRTGCCRRSAGSCRSPPGAAMVGGVRDHVGPFRAALVAVRGGLSTPLSSTLRRTYGNIPVPPGATVHPESTLGRVHGGLVTSTEAPDDA